MKIVVLHNAVSANDREDERDVMVQAAAISDALASSGKKTALLAADTNLAALESQLTALKPDAVFNLVESLRGRGELIVAIPALLEALNLTYTGATLDAMAISSSKLIAKRWMRANNLATPDWCQISDVTQYNKGKWIVKPVWEDGSVGITDASVVDAKDMEKLLKQNLQQNNGSWFAERYIDGREFNISILQSQGHPQVLPIAEIEFRDYASGKPRIVGYDAKWNSDTFEYQNTTRRFLGKEETRIRKQLTGLALKTWNVFGLTGYARVDVRSDSEGNLWILEVNANPCLSPEAGFQAALKEANISFSSAIGSIVDVACAMNSAPVNDQMLNAGGH